MITGGIRDGAMEARVFIPLDSDRSSLRVKTQNNTRFRRNDLFPISGEMCETPTLLGTLERANLNH
jgi:hypothetical protein